jgi:hypothetical protein
MIVSMRHSNAAGAEPLDALLRATLLGEPVEWPEPYREADAARFLEIAAGHGIQPLVYYQLLKAGHFSNWPERVVVPLKGEAARQTILSAVLGRELRHVLDALARANIFPLLMKGTPLSYTHYPAPYLRPRCDTDLLIQKSDLPSATDILIDLGYAGSNAVTGDLVSHQVTYTKETETGVRFQLDLHWKIANPHLFADIFAFSELERRSISLPALGDHARALGNVHALLLACVHRIAHHYDSDNLLWIYDIHLLAGSMGRAEREEFVRLALEYQLRAICLRGLRLAQRWFDTRLPEGLIDQGLSKGDGEPVELSERYIRPDLRRLDLLLLDLGQLRGWRKMQLLKELLFPPGEYMLERYNRSNRSILPMLYLHRGLVGIWKFLGRLPH